MFTCVHLVHILIFRYANNHVCCAVLSYEPTIVWRDSLERTNVKRFRGGLITLIASATTNQAGAHAADVTPRCIGFFVHFSQRQTVLLLTGWENYSHNFFPWVPFQFHEIGGKIPGGFCGTKVNTDLVSKTPSGAVFPFLDMNIITTKHTFHDINCTKQRIPMKKRGQNSKGYPRCLNLWQQRRIKHGGQLAGYFGNWFSIFPRVIFATSQS